MKVVSIGGLVSVQWIADTVGIVRYHDGGGGFGSPFSFSLTMVREGGDALFYAALGCYTRATHRAMRDAMYTIGVKRVRYERRTATARAKVLTR